MNVRNNLARLRRKHGISAMDLASEVGISRQTIYAVEAGKYVPNTLVALQLAEALSVGVEEIFCLDRRRKKIRSSEDRPIIEQLKLQAKAGAARPRSRQ